MEILTPPILRLLLAFWLFFGFCFLPYFDFIAAAQPRQTEHPLEEWAYGKTYGKCLWKMLMEKLMKKANEKKLRKDLWKIYEKTNGAKRMIRV